MPSCNLCGRTQNSKSKEKHITFHRYPKYPEIREKWIEFSRGYNEHRSIVVNEKSVVCSAHFVADSFNVYIKKTLLKPTAVPSLIIQRVRFGKLDYPEITINLHSDDKQKVDDMEDVGCGSRIISNNSPKLFEPKMDGIECLELSSSFGKIANPNDSSVSNISDNEFPTMVNRELFVKASVVENNDTPIRQFLKQSISVLCHDSNLRSKRIKILNQTIQRQKKKIASLKNIISKLKDLQQD